MSDQIEHSLSHAKERAFERYGLRLETHHLEAIIEAIRDGRSQKAEFIKRQSSYRTIWRVKMFDRSLIVVYNKRHRVITTFLTEEMIGGNNERIGSKLSRFNAHRLWWKNRKS